MSTEARPVLTIVIKAFNEEAKIGQAIESALAAAGETGPSTEIIVADSLSTDRTIDIASQFPVKVVQLAAAEERGCGAGTQLGFQHAQGNLVYFMDGDMQLTAGFLPRALAELESDSQLAGVAGLVVDTRILNDIDRIRINNKSVTKAGGMPWLGGGGLYRRQAIASAGGYAADKNLKGYEEADLGLRLRAAGWRLLRLPLPAVQHTGHDLDTWPLLNRHWRSGRAMAGGVLLKSAFGKPWFWQVVRMLAHPLATLGWWLGLAAGLLLVEAGRLGQFAALWLSLPLAAMLHLAWRKGRLRHALVSIAIWHYAAAALLIGLGMRQRDPLRPIGARLLHDGAAPRLARAR